MPPEITTPPDELVELSARAAGAFGKGFKVPYRGTVAENAKRFRLVGKAYEAMPAEQNGYFDLDSCRHLAGPLAAWLHPDIRKILVRKAVQTQGSLVVDLIIPYIIEHQPRNTLVLFETDPKALNYCSVRLMDTLHQHPVIGPMISGVESVSRHDITTTYLKLPGMTLMVGGLNDSNVSSLSWPNVLISEAWFHKDDGLLYKAFGRTTQFERDCKILVESQAGMDGEDFARECELATRVPLTWECPYCEARQEFEFSQTRPDDFVARPVLHFKEGDLPMQVAPKPGSYAGMIFDGATKMVDGVETSVSIEDRARSARWQCYHCGSDIIDTPAMRRRLMASYEQRIPGTVTATSPQPSPPGAERETDLAAISPGVTPRAVLFDWPEEASLNISFAESTRHFLTADAAQRMGNIIPKQDWYMQRRARTWSPQLDQKQILVSVGSYDPDQIIPDEHSRDMMVDCQKHPTLDTVGTFWYVARVVDKFGNSRQLARGFANSWEEWIKVQKHFKIPNARVALDASKWTPQIMLKAAAEYEVVTGMFLGRPQKYNSCWRLFFGDIARSFKHPDGQSRGWSPPRSIPMTIFDKDGRRIVIRLQAFRWSNISFELQLDAIRMGTPGSPKFLALDRKQLPPETQAKEVGDLTYDKQMSATYLTEKKGKQIYDKLRPNNHYRDCELMGLVRMSMDGLIGHTAAGEATGGDQGEQDA